MQENTNENETETSTEDQRVEKNTAYPELIDQETRLPDFTDERLLATIKRNVCPPDITNSEFAMFMGHCQSTGLNPLKKEIWCIKVQGKVHSMVGINGFFAIANNNPTYDGIEVETTFDEQHTPEKSICKAYRKDRKRPSVGVARWAEDAGSPKTQWGQRPTLMLEKVAKARALRELFPQNLNGVLLPEEVMTEQQAHGRTFASQMINEALNQTLLEGEQMEETEVVNEIPQVS